MGKFLTTKRSRKLFTTLLVIGLGVLGLTGIAAVAFIDPLPWQFESSIPWWIKLAQLPVLTLGSGAIAMFAFMAFVAGLYFLFGYLPRKFNLYGNALSAIEDFFAMIGRGITFPFRTLNGKVKSWVNQGE